MSAQPTPGEIRAAKRIVAIVDKTLSAFGSSLGNAESLAAVSETVAQLIAKETGGMMAIEALIEIRDEKSPGEQGDFGAGENSVIERHAELARAVLTKLEGQK